MVMGQNHHTQWIETPMVPRFRPHMSQRLVEGSLLKFQPKGAEHQTVEGSHGDNKISRSNNDPAMTGEHADSAPPSVTFVGVGPNSETLVGATHVCPCGETTLTTDSDQSVQESEQPQSQRRGLAGGARGDPLIIPGSTGRKLVSAPLSWAPFTLREFEYVGISDNPNPHSHDVRWADTGAVGRTDLLPRLMVPFGTPFPSADFPVQQWQLDENYNIDPESKYNQGLGVCPKCFLPSDDNVCPGCGRNGKRATRSQTRKEIFNSKLYLPTRSYAHGVLLDTEYPQRGDNSPGVVQIRQRTVSSESQARSHSHYGGTICPPHYGGARRRSTH